jgi:hypothetical protein
VVFFILVVALAALMVHLKKRVQWTDAGAGA